MASAKKQNGNIGCFGLIVLAGLAWFIWGKFQENTKSPEVRAAEKAEAEKVAAENDKKRQAINVCSAAIKTSLKNPDTASIHDIVGTTFLVNQAGNFKVSIGFEAKNDFGAEIKNTGYCTITPNYQLVDFQTARK